MKRIIITGTSRGIGFEMVKLLAQQDCEILALSRNDQPVKELNLDNVTTFSFDLSSAEDLTKVEGFLKDNWKRVDVLINNAGKLVNKNFEEITSEELMAVYQTNTLGAFQLTQKVVPFMKTDGHVVNISTMGGVQGSVKFPGLAAYSSSKAAIITLTELLAEEYKEKGPAFNVLALGAVKTEMLEEAFPGYEPPTTAEEMAAYIVDFALTGNKYYNGKLLQVSNSTP
ncbi:MULTISPECIES: SDR family NAD(P)-dependent oxidoreductase [Mesonia]|uniref:3-oxoacyl-[acyl-carrier-protein] reductase FabG n=1 Tax=Mesonia oceanica TaxID=2687242 RepID=A0AC61Y5J2_9FLAO|nr:MULTISPECIES: SDR family oxidoreductase [Mesonia]MAN28920.1 short-chain dehydrogenase [Mesonia sp.]MAQ42701.1 short-chain dehydrogenase [Mesonia sp.]MBJ99238.1 short-chain dehydrogenase [Flavobacteriaceae bacterium]VVU99763.1 3-oxoacyl-[acyl-carrier-protein] reductase FabG [Mesonia oceanica]|tara:strand:+ start:545 stop:1225 length:681 start_codon:yes stop_codon:yes gene_type:complete